MNRKKMEQMQREKEERAAEINRLIDRDMFEKKEVLEQYIEEQGFAPLNHIEGVPSIEPVSKTWVHRQKSNIVKWLMSISTRSLEEVAAGIGCTEAYLNNKLQRDSFSVEDIIIIAYICGFGLTFTSITPDIEKRATYQIDVQEFFRLTHGPTLKKLLAYDKDLKERKKKDYEMLKIQLERMKAEFGFED